MQRAMLTQKNGMPLTKLRVPSSGSTTQTQPSVAVSVSVSSESTRWSGNSRDGITARARAGGRPPGGGPAIVAVAGEGAAEHDLVAEGADLSLVLRQHRARRGR